MIVPRKKLSFWERLYLPALAGGLKVTSKHFVNTLFRGNTAAKETSDGFYPEHKWIVGEGYRGAPYLVPALRIRLPAEGHPHHAARPER
jgi:hypothetical protein